jgi:hypothetical protein
LVRLRQQQNENKDQINNNNNNSNDVDKNERKKINPRLMKIQLKQTFVHYNYAMIRALGSGRQQQQRRRPNDLCPSNQ